MNDNIDGVTDTITMAREHAEALVLAANVLTEMWGELGGDEQITLGDLDDRLIDAGLAFCGPEDGTEADDRIELDNDLVAAISQVGEALGHGDDKRDFEADVASAERHLVPR